MATLLELVGRGELLKLDPQLEPNEQEWRSIYVLPDAGRRIRTDILTWTSQWEITVSPVQQLDSLAEIFCAGETLTFERIFKPLVHLGDGVWELKTPDLRLFGWFPAKDCFVGAFLDNAFNVKTYNLYRGYVEETVRLRNQLDLNEPKFVPGSDPDAVVTNYDFP